MLTATAVTVSINIIEFLAFAAALFIMTIIMLRVYLPAATQVPSRACNFDRLRYSSVSMFMLAHCATQVLLLVCTCLSPLCWVPWRPPIRLRFFVFFVPLQA